jgi:hypothetical protein
MEIEFESMQRCEMEDYRERKKAKGQNEPLQSGGISHDSGDLYDRALAAHKNGAHTSAASLLKDAWFFSRESIPLSRRGGKVAREILAGTLYPPLAEAALRVLGDPDIYWRKLKFDAGNLSELKASMSPAPATGEINPWVIIKIVFVVIWIVIAIARC